MLKKFSHWTPRYIYNRVALAVYEKQHPDHPWLTRYAISILSNLFQKTDVGIEWVSGRSTVWIAERIKHLISVEDAPEWYEKVGKVIKAKELNNLEYILCKTESSYVGVADKFPPASLDFVLVDGRSYRSKCAVNAVSKIRMGGFIVVDNANWFLPSPSHSPNSRSYEDGPASDEWQHFLDLVKYWRLIWTSNGVTDTAIFIKK